MAANISRTTAVNAAIFSPEMICSAVTPLTNPPNVATPIAPPTCRAALSTAEAVPDRVRSTLDRMAVVWRRSESRARKPDHRPTRRR
jgi:hypothetical protein